LLSLCPQQANLKRNGGRSEPHEEDCEEVRRQDLLEVRQDRSAGEGLQGCWLSDEEDDDASRKDGEGRQVLILKQGRV